MKKRTPEQKLLLDQLAQIANGLAQTFAPFCEVVLHDLCSPTQAVVAIHNNLSGRQIDDPATELGLARMQDPNYEQVIANYPNQLPDGRRMKSTSIGIKDSNGQYVAALCMNIDLTLFQSFQGMLNQFISVQGESPMQESFDSTGGNLIRAYIDKFAAKLALTPRTLKAEEKRLLIKELKSRGMLDMRRSMETIAAHLGISRASVYSYAK